MNIIQRPKDYTVGSTLVKRLDRFAVNNYNATVENNITKDNIGNNIIIMHWFVQLTTN